jgi:dethiobiotin synthetase
MGAGLFVTGTDTGVGKTWITSLIVRGLRQMGRGAVGLKPFACGDRLDAEALYEANGGVLSMDAINPVWMRVPAAPLAASMIESRMVDLDLARESVREVAGEHPFVLVEGVGGWRVPLTASVCASDFAVELGWPALVVVANRLGALNHARLTIESIRARGLAVAGVVWNETRGPEDDPARWTNPAVLETVLPGELYTEVAFGAESLSAAFLEELWRRGGGEI